MCPPCVVIVYNCTMHKAAARISVIPFKYVFLFILKLFVSSFAEQNTSAMY